MKKSFSILNSDVRRVFLLLQGLWGKTSHGKRLDPIAAIESLGVVQLDAIRTVERSQYLTIYARTGSFDIKSLDEAIYSKKVAFEQWAHVSSWVPAKDLLMLWPIIAKRTESKISNRKKQALGDDYEKRLKEVLSEVVQNGPIRPKDLATLLAGEGSTGWWRRTPTTMALDLLFRRGEVFVERRSMSFERYFVAADKYFTSRPMVTPDSISVAQEWVVLRSISCLGVATVSDIADYYRMDKKETIQTLNRLKRGRKIVEVNVQGWDEIAYTTEMMLDKISELHSSGCESKTIAFLSPFDNLIWTRDRVERVFGFRFRNQMYHDVSSRTQGYYSMPILSKGHLCGLLDSKVERKNAEYVINEINLTNVSGFHPEEVWDAISSLASFLGCTAIRMGSDNVRSLFHGLY